MEACAGPLDVGGAVGSFAPPIVSGIYLPETLAYYEVGIFLTPLLAFIVGVQAAANVAQLRRLLGYLSAFGALIATHTIIAASTGTFVLETTHQASYLAARSDFTLADSTTSRIGSFLQNPDWNGALLAFMACIALGVAFASTSIAGRLLGVLETVVIIVALLFTFSYGAWVGLAIGLLAFLLLVASWRARAWLITLIVAIVGVGGIILQKEVGLLVRHGSTPGELSLRIGAWRTALHIIEAFPLTGIGWGLLNYQEKAEPFRVAQQYRELAHPHNSYLELGAMGGLPVLVVFLVLLAGVIRLTWKNCSSSRLPNRALFCGILAATIALAVNSVTINAWTLPPIACVAWLVLGAGASPALRTATARGIALVHHGPQANTVRQGELALESVRQ